MPVVYIAQMPRRRVGPGEFEPAHDVSPAREHGELVELLSPTAKPWTPSVVDELVQGLMQVTADDYILMIGNPCLSAMAVAIMADELDGKVNMLQWSGTERRYIPVRMELWNPNF